ncbi:uncharacterized protein LOC144124006 [Amblyomma americanum]
MPVYGLYLILVASLLLAHSKPWTQSEPHSEACSTAGCTELERVLESLSNASVDPCDDFYEHVCGGLHGAAGEEGVPRQRPLGFRALQRRSLNELLARTLATADPDSFPGDVRPLIYTYKYCLLVMKDHLVDAVEVHALLARHNLSAELFRSAERATVIEHLARLAEHGDLVPALRVRHAAAPHDAASSNTSDDGEECWLQPGSPFRLASLEPAIRTGQLATLLSKVADADVVAAELHSLETAPLQALRLHLLLCSTANLLRSELRKLGPTFWPGGACVDDLHRAYPMRAWNRLLWLVVQPWNKDLQVREQVHAVRHHLLAYVDHSSAPFEQKVNVTDALRNLSLAYTRARDPESSAVQLELHYGKLPDMGWNVTSGDRKWPYYATLDYLMANKPTPESAAADAALPEMAFNYTEHRLYLSLGALVPPAFDDDYDKDLLAATLGYWAARTILDAQRDVSPGWSLSTCLSVQAGGILSAQEKAGLFATALAFKVALDSAQELSGNRLATPRDRARMRLVFRAACGGLCELPSGRNIASKDAPTRRMQPKFSVVDGHRMCHAAVLNAPLFFLLFGCEPTSQMSQTGVCPLS